MATDYWWNFTGNTNQVAAAGATTPYGLSGWGQTTTSLVATDGTAGDLNASGDFTPSHILTNATADTFITPRMFGGYDQFQRVSDVLGYVPTGLILDYYSAWTVHTTNETVAFIGMTSPACVDAAAAGSGGCVTSNATNFVLVSDNGSDAGALVATTWHRTRIQYGTAAGLTTTEWFTDLAVAGTLASHGTITTELDIWPLSFKAFVGTNDFGISWVHLWYGP
jgi:hypothetical protein